MNDPDINKPTEIVDAILQIPVLGGHSRTLTPDPDGQMKPTRYLECLGDYISPTRVREWVESQLGEAAE